MAGVLLLTFAIFSGSPITISEVLANVKGSDSGLPGQRNEFVEIHNLSPDTIDIHDWYIHDLDQARPDEICEWNDSTLLLKYPNVRISTTLLGPGSFALILDRDYTRPDTGQYLMPYALPDGVLIVTTDDNSIGDGLSTKDPVIVYHKDLACTTSYGTPFNGIDTIPFDPGDGVSAERMDLALPDSIDNWWPSLDPSGSSPGRTNSTALAIDLSVDGHTIKVTPALIETGEDAEIEVPVTNCGLRPCADWSLRVFQDGNNNGVDDPGEVLAEHAGSLLRPGQSIAFKTIYPRPPLGEHVVGARMVCSVDREPSNNIATRAFSVVGKVGSMAISPQVFSPDGDGIDDLVQIDYRLPRAGGELAIAIFDANGIRRHDILRSRSATQDHGTVFWNGRNRAGRALAAGIYIVFMEYRCGSRSIRAKKTVVIAKRH